MLRYTKEHDWLDENDGVVTIGLTAHAISELGDIVYVGLPDEGAEVERGEEIVAIDSTKVASGIEAPFDAVVTAVNQEVADSPETITADSWFVRLTPTGEANLDEYLDEAAYQALID